LHERQLSGRRLIGYNRCRMSAVGRSRRCGVATI